MPHQVRPGTKIDDFLVGEQIHSGAMSNIFEVTRPGDSTKMIMKAPRVGRGEPTEGVIGIQTEGVIAPALCGPHAPRCIAVGDLAKKPYVVLEWIAGIGLEEILEQGSLPAVEVARIGAAIGDALHSLHQQEVIHLDLKPANVILKADGTATLIDFGFAHHARYPDLLSEETRWRAGSAAYVSPEQLLGTREDPRSDLFSLGVVLYEMATGYLPFGEPDTNVRNRFWLDPVPPKVRSQDVPPWLQEIILRCLEPRAALRYQSAKVVAFDLRNPEQVVLTSRATKSQQAALFQQVRRFWKAHRELARRSFSPAVQLSHSPIVMVAVDTLHMDDERHEAIRSATAQMLSFKAEFRLICVSVIPLAPVLEGPVPAETASGRHLEHLARLRRWVEPLGLSAQQLSLHAIESSDAAETLLELARLNNVDLIVLGAPGPTQPGKSWWRSVASTVTASAQCSVHVVRVPGRRDARPLNREPPIHGS